MQLAVDDVFPDESSGILWSLKVTAILSHRNSATMPAAVPMTPKTVEITVQPSAIILEVLS